MARIKLAEPKKIKAEINAELTAEVKIISEENLKKLVLKLLFDNEVYAPVYDTNNGVAMFKQVDKCNISQLAINKLSYNPAKPVFFRKKEVLFEFDLKNTSNLIVCECRPKKPKVLIGLKRCELNSIMHQDVVFNEAGDCWYGINRLKTLLIGYHCAKEQDNYCFCNSLELKEYYDLMLYDSKDGYVVEAATLEGKKFLQKNKSYFKSYKKGISNDMKKVIGANSLNPVALDARLSNNFNNAEWKKLAEPCLGCSACNILCPSCYCFDIYDKVCLSDVRKGARMRKHSSCQLLSFTDIRGKPERFSREERLKHRVYHQLKYFKDSHGVALCTGCGRCIRHCPVRINFIGVINRLK